MKTLREIKDFIGCVITLITKVICEITLIKGIETTLENAPLSFSSVRLIVIINVAFSHIPLNSDSHFLYGFSYIFFFKFLGTKQNFSLST